MLNIVSHSEKETMTLGARIVGFLGSGDIICLFGTLGAGKTILVKGMAAGLGVNKSLVNSPSFVLIQEYPPAKKHKKSPILYHLDLFRLRDLGNIVSLGYEEYLYGKGICVIEWADRMKRLLPSEFLKVVLEIKGIKKRVIKLIPRGMRYRKLLQENLIKLNKSK